MDLPALIEKYTPLAKKLLATLVGLAGVLAVADAHHDLVLPATLAVVCHYIIVIGAGLGIVSTGVEKPEEKP